MYNKTTHIFTFIKCSVNFIKIVHQRQLSTPMQKLTILPTILKVKLYFIMKFYLLRRKYFMVNTTTTTTITNIIIYSMQVGNFAILNTH